MQPLFISGTAPSDLMNQALLLNSAFVEAYNRLKTATLCVAECKRSQEDAERTLQRGRDAILISYKDDPKGLGHNEATREAAIRTMSPSIHAEVALSEMRLSTARQEMDEASIDVEGLRAQLRCLEVATALLAGGDANGRK